MSEPGAFTVEECALFCAQLAGPIGDALGWYAAAGDYQPVIDAALLAYGDPFDLAQISGADPIKKLRALLRVEVWRRICDYTAGDFDFKADGGTFSRSQVYAQAVSQLHRAEADAIAFVPAYQVTPIRMEYKNDPYQYRPEEERTL